MEAESFDVPKHAEWARARIAKGKIIQSAKR